MKFILNSKEVDLRDTSLDRARKLLSDLPAQDASTCAEIARRLAKAAIDKRVLTYGDVVRGITITADSLNSGRPYVCDIVENTLNDRDQVIVDAFLTWLSLHSFKEAGILANALIRDRLGNPTVAFLSLARALGVFTELGRPDPLKRKLLWARELKKVHSFFEERAARGAGM